MPEQPPGPPAASDVRASLHAIAGVLRSSPPLGREAQKELADLLDDLGDDLGPAAVPPEEVAHLAEGLAHFARVAHERREAGILAAARDRVEQSILATEAQTPVLAGVARRLLDALANIGI